MNKMAMDSKERIEYLWMVVRAQRRITVEKRASVVKRSSQYIRENTMRFVFEFFLSLRSK